MGSRERLGLRNMLTSVRVSLSRKMRMVTERGTQGAAGSWGGLWLEATRRAATRFVYCTLLNSTALYCRHIRILEILVRGRHVTLVGQGGASGNQQAAGTGV